ncbi:ABC transporter ATP-binding protein [Candidatus Bathyarchaeota archaeon]|nr:ABC transporter ATP-binding protein [Candidatus Bathyarchaeota archaeon]
MENVEYPALRGIDMDVYGGEFLAVVGPSGSGKSTLLHIIGGLDTPTKGRVIVEGSDISGFSGEKLADYRNRMVGFIFQFYNLLPYLRAVENVELPMAIANVNPSKRRDRALELLRLVGLGDKAFKRPTELSGGEQQRVAIARSLINEPRLILADEPTGNIDSSSAGVIMEIFRRLVDEKGVSIVMVTHNLELIRFCDRVIKLRDGKIVEVEAPSK